MPIERLTSEEYASLFPRPSHVFDSVEFSELNRGKCDDVHYLAWSDADGKVRLGMILGERGDRLLSPFSAPFGGCEPVGNSRLEFYLSFTSELREYAGSLGKTVRITLPPSIYGADGNVEKLLCSALSAGFRVEYNDYNYHYPIKNRFPDFRKYASKSAIRNLLRALRMGFTFIPLSFSADNLSRVYEVVRSNHEALGYPVKMSEQQILDTSRVIDMDLFILRLGDEDVASALVYSTTPTVRQLIYWGDRREYSFYCPMNALANNILEYYYNQGVETLDLGPASEDGIPAVGLCAFKEKLGCVLTPKMSIICNL